MRPRAVAAVLAAGLAGAACTPAVAAPDRPAVPLVAVPGPAGDPACTHRGYTLMPGQRVPAGGLSWWYDPGGLDRRWLDPAAAQRAVLAAARTAAAGVNDCAVTAAARIPPLRYRGRIHLAPPASRDADGCPPADGRSVVQWGPVPGAAGVTCTSVGPDGRTVVEADVVIDTGTPWFTGPVPPRCRRDWRADLRTAVTHEFGHVLGLGHAVGPAAVGQTMAAQLAPCSTAKRTFGAGDAAGLLALYGAGGAR